MIDPVLCSPKEACKVLNIGKTTLYGLIKNGQLESVKLGRRRLIVTQSIRALLNLSPQTEIQEKPEFGRTKAVARALLPKNFSLEWGG